MTLEQSKRVISQYQQWLANAQLDLALASAKVAELTAVAKAPADA